MTMSEYEISQGDIIYQKKLNGPEYYDPDGMILTVIQTLTQTQLIISSDPPQLA